MTFEKIEHGGKRDGAGRPKTEGSTRDIKKQIRWHEQEWGIVEQSAKLVGMDVSKFQRKCILDRC